MKRKLRGIFLACVVGLAAPALPAEADGPVRVLVVTGGHEYPTSFYTVFEQEGLAWDHAVSNDEAFRSGLQGRYGAVVVYDVSKRIAGPA